MSLIARDLCRRLMLHLGLIALCGWAMAARAGFWVTAYYPGYEQAYTMPASAIDFTAVTHIVHFSVVPNSNGTINSAENYLTLANSTNLVALAHAAGVKVLVCVGGASSESGFQGAASAANLSALINSLTNFVASRGYDGVDIDWEPCPSTDFLLYTNLVTGLRSALNKLRQPQFLTVAAGAYPSYDDSATVEYAMYNAVQNQLDQINIMTYDLSGPYDGWVTWFNSPIYDGGYRFASSGGLVPSLEGALENFLTNGVAPGRLGVGIPFYGYVWTGGTGSAGNNLTQPRQSWINPPTITAYRYTDIMADYYQPDLYQWDASAQAAYLSITNAVATNDVFLSYDDSRACQAKVSYARNNKLGGVMIWELSQDHTGVAPDPLLQAVKQALATPGQTTLRRTANNVTVAFNTAPLGSYEVQWSSNLAGNGWNSLVTTNVTGPGGTLQINDAGVATNQSRRFYRIQTPP